MIAMLSCYPALRVLGDMSFDPSGAVRTIPNLRVTGTRRQFRNLFSGLAHLVR